MSMGKLARKQILKWLMQKVKFFMCLKYFYKIDKYGFVCKKKIVRPGRCKACAVKSLELFRILSFLSGQK